MTRRGDKEQAFPITSWSLVGQASSLDEALCQAALRELIEIYAPAMKHYLIGIRRLSEDIAEDILHDFFLDKVLAQKLVHRADRQKGKFRNYVLRSLNNYVATRLSREGKERAQAVELDESLMADDSCTPEAFASAFDKGWVGQVILESLRLMEEECRGRRRTDVWDVFELRVIRPLTDNREPLDYSELVNRFHLQSPRQAINLLATAKRCFIRNVRSVIGRYIAGEKDIEEEIALFYEIVSQ